MNISSRTMQNLSTLSIIFSLAITVLITASLLTSCASVPTCKETPAIGNAGAVFNTPLDEYSPVIFDGKLYYTAMLDETGKAETIMKSEFLDGKLSSPRSADGLPLEKVPSSGLPAFYYNPKTGITELYFAGATTTQGKIHRDIYFSELIDGVWTTPTKLNEAINTNQYESHPSISPDGEFLLFVSDRKGGFGDLDIYVSRRSRSGFWQPAENIGASINTSGKEISPAFGPDGDIFFTSNAYPGMGGDDIIRAERLGEDIYGNSRALNFPINTDGNESGAAFIANTIYISSDRRGGCGGKDLYAFELCGPVSLEFNLTSKKADVPLEGTLYVDDVSAGKTNQYSIDNSGVQVINIMPDREYNLRYFNSCFPHYLPEQTIYSPCSDSSSVKMVAEFLLPVSKEKFDFEAYKIPFFVTGYYYPNTKENLEALRLKFSYNLFGTSQTTAYIENPGKKYDTLSIMVEEALNDASEFIYQIITNLTDDCTSKGAKLSVDVTGYADPRAISESAIYSEETLSNPKFGISVEKGTPMNNELLSKLRAYYTALHIDSYLAKTTEYSHLRDKIVWTIKGMGIDESTSLANEYKRRVNIEIGVRSDNF